MTTYWKSTLALGLLSISSHVFATNDKLTLEDCHLDGIKQQVQCGKLQVPENYAKPEGNEITVNFAVIPAIDKTQNKEPLMFLAGGPGQAAVELAAMIRQGFTEVRKTRDIILVDQRGTGKSHPLQCENGLEMDPYVLAPEAFGTEEIKECLDALEGDLSQFNSENAIRDFDAVRAALGHEKINIYGGSYGTRAGLVYMKLFPESLRSVILDSVGPIEVPIGTFGQSAARSFNKLIENCQAEEACHKAYPNLRQEFDEIVKRLKESPIDINVAHPRLGTNTPLKITLGKFIATLRMQLYSVSGRSLVPLVIHQAYQQNYMPFAGLIAASEGGMGMYIGLTMNIVCNEDIPRVTPEMIAADANNNFGGADSHSMWLKACPIWPQYRPEANFYEPVTANIPTLILSGDLDPVTPPSNGDYPDKTLPNSKHIIAKNTAHIVAKGTCALDIINEFLEGLDPNALDESCLEKLPNESFMTGLNGSN